jgi:hypothetical protein
MWWIAEFEAVTLFSLKMSTATATGGKTLLVPTPYALKMALLDGACRVRGVEQARTLWPQIRDLGIGISPAKIAVVNNLFQKVLRPRRRQIPFDQPDAGPFQKTIGYREYVHLLGPLSFAFGWAEDNERPWLKDLLQNIHYLGKRGGFMQLLDQPKRVRDLPPRFINASEEQAMFAINGTLQILDDCASTLTFEKANVYSGESIRMGRERITRNVVLPYRMVRSSRSFTLYQRID